MGLRTIIAMAFVHELEKIGSDLELSLSGVTAKEAESVIKASFLEPLLKVAKPRYAREALNAAQAGDTNTLNQIAGAHEQLGLKGREAGALGGGAEAGAFLNLGRAPGQVGGPNHHVEKFYNPESGISRGDYTRQLVEQKKKFTDTARAMSPEARAMVPEMHGSESKNIGTPTQRTRSTHEFVPGMQSMRQMDNRGEMLDQVEKNVISPMKARGMSMGDTMREDVDKAGDPTRKVNFGNVVSSQTGPKVVDFLPHEQGQQYLPGQSFGAHAPNILKDNVDMSPRQAKAEFYNPKTQVHQADTEGQAKAKATWQRSGQTPDFEVNAVPFHARQQKQQQSQEQSAPTARAGNISSPLSKAPTNVAGVPTPSPRAPAMAPSASMPTNILPPAVRPAAPGALAAPVATAAQHMPTFRPTLPKLPALARH